MPRRKVPTVEELFDAGVHLGHSTRKWHPAAEPFIYTSKNGVHIINLEKTHDALKEAVAFLEKVGESNGQVIFVGTKRQTSELVRLEAKNAGALYVTERWLGGTITNFSVIKERIDRLVRMRKAFEEGTYDKYTKKERLMLDRAMQKLEASVGGLVGLKGLPSALVVVDARREKTAVKEAMRRNVPIVALVDTDTDPRGITYPIPGNDDAIKSIAIIIKTLADALARGYAKAKKEAEKQEKESAKAKESPRYAGDTKNKKTGAVESDVSEDTEKAPQKKAFSAKKEESKQSKK